jgi:hypothetical protein
MQVRFKHLVEDRDRHGNIRIYARVPGRRKVRIRAPFGTDEFVEAYNAAVSTMSPRLDRPERRELDLFDTFACCTSAARHSSDWTRQRSHGDDAPWTPCARSTPTSQWL